MAKSNPTNTLKAVIIAGGLGTRLNAISTTVPKILTPIEGRPLLDYQLRLLTQYNITTVYLMLGHLSKPVLDYIQDGSQWGLTIHTCIEEKPLGTAGCLHGLKPQPTDDLLVIYGDIMVNMDLEKLHQFHITSKADITLVVHPNDHPYDSDLVEVNDQHRIHKIHPKPHSKGLIYQNLVNAGVYLLSPKIRHEIPTDKSTDLAKDIFPRLLDRMNVYAYNTPEYIKDMGTVDRLDKVTTDIQSGRVTRAHLSHKRPALFLDRDGVINKMKGLLSHPDEFDLLPGVIDAILTINASDFLAIVVTNQSVIARNLCSLDTLKSIHNKMETLLGHHGAKLDAIFFCPHHPDSGYPEENPAYKIDCNCRKPKTGMIQQAISEFNIDIANSYMIGDSERDILAGHHSGLKTIGVLTGEGCKNCSITPNHMANSLLDAVRIAIPSSDAY